MKQLESYNSYAIKDDYMFWSAKRGAAEGGKLFLLDENSKNVHQIFFDDNINQDLSFSIVDIRNSITGEKLAYPNVIDKYMVQVDPRKAILDESYFVKKVRECEFKRSQERISSIRKKSHELEFVCKRKADSYLEFPKYPKVSTSSRRGEDSIHNISLLCLLNRRLTQFEGEFLIKEEIRDEETEFIK